MLHSALIEAVIEPAERRILRAAQSPKIKAKKARKQAENCELQELTKTGKKQARKSPKNNNKNKRKTEPKKAPKN